MQMNTRPSPTPDPIRKSALIIDRGSIARAAIKLLDEVGFEGLTMRSLAKKLEIKAASLYWHLSSKQDLMGLLSEEICAPIQEPDRSLPWLEQLEALAHEYRRVLLLHRDAARVLSSSGGAMGPKRLRLAEIVLRTLLNAGFDPKDAAHAGLMMNDYVTMFVAEETQFVAGNTDQPDEDAVVQAKNWFEGLSKKEFPSMVSLAPFLAAPDPDERFQFGIQILKTGLEAYRMK